MVGCLEFNLEESSGRRLNPVTVSDSSDMNGGRCAILVKIGGFIYQTTEVLQDDSSIPYLFWWDANGRYHQQFLGGGMFIHISDSPVAVRRTTVDLSVVSDKSPQIVDGQ